MVKPCFNATGEFKHDSLCINKMYSMKDAYLYLLKIKFNSLD